MYSNWITQNLHFNIILPSTPVFFLYRPNQILFRQIWVCNSGAYEDASYQIIPHSVHVHACYVAIAYDYATLHAKILDRSTIPSTLQYIDTSGITQPVHTSLFKSHWLSPPFNLLKPSGNFTYDQA
jgi:hypothetical protein